MEYTKGEWILDFSEEHNGVISIYVPKKGTVAKIFTRSCDDYEANAHLIAAAPSLYEALKHIITGKRKDGKYDRYDAAGFVKTAENAIVEVEGS